MISWAAMEIAEIDRSLAADGEDFVLRRVTGTAIPTNTDVTCRGFVRQFRPDELTTNIIQGDSGIILSPTQIEAASWPGLPAGALDTRVPRRGDKAVVQGRIRNIEAATPIYLNGTLVRLELQVRG